VMDDHYIPIDFTGWRYFELIESESEGFRQYVWPYRNTASAEFSGTVNHAAIAQVNFYYNNLPPNAGVDCEIGPVKTVPYRQATIRNPRILIAGQTVTFPINISTGQYLEFDPQGDCRVYDATGHVRQNVRPTGEVPTLANGSNNVTFSCDREDGYNPRAFLTVSAAGNILK